MRQKLVIANWKMYKSRREAAEFMENLKDLLPLGNFKAVICPPFTALAEVADGIEDLRIALGAQNCHPAEKGAFTGEISLSMLAEYGCRYVICGHSERRGLFGEDDHFVRQKAEAILAAGMDPVLCVGETLEQRVGGKAETVISAQIVSAFAGLQTSDAARIIVAYEPIWAIGTGKNASAQDASDISDCIRDTITKLYDADFADDIPVLYGGSVKPDNITDFVMLGNIDGALVGGASLDAASFSLLISAFSEA